MPPAPPGAPGPSSCSRLGRWAPARGRRLPRSRSSATPAPRSLPDDETALRGLISAGPVVKAVAHAGDEAVRDAVAEAIVPNRRDDGSYRFENVWRFAIGRKA